MSNHTCPPSCSSHLYKEEDLSWFDATQENENEAHPLALVVSDLVGMVGNKQRDPDTMTMQEAMRQPDKNEFVKAMYKELHDHIERKHWKVVLRNSMAKDKRAIPMVWSMKRK